MWNNIVKFSNFRAFTSIPTRCYLTKAYNLDSEWSKRLDNQILRQVNIENLYVDLDTKFVQQKKINAIDVDIYTNKISDFNQQDEMIDVLSKLRRTEEASKISDSTQHAVVRNLMESNNFELLVTVLSDREGYGVFLDDHTANMLLDKLISEKNYKIGARIATIWMLQEDFSNAITCSMSIYHCFKFLENLEDFDDLKPVVEEAPVEGQKKKKKEEIKIRVRYLKNEYFDDHFDLKNTNHLLGKTFLYLAGQLKDESLSKSFKLLGYSLYEKYEEGNLFLNESKGSTFYKEIVEKVKGFGVSVGENEAGKQFYSSVEGLTALKDEAVEPIIESLIKSAVKENESKEIAKFKDVYTSWIAEREEKLQKEITRHQRIQRLLDIERSQEELEVEEKKLWFFENEEQINLEIDKKQNVFYPRKWHGKRKKKRVIEEGYVPPDVDSRRNK